MFKKQLALFTGIVFSLFALNSYAAETPIGEMHVMNEQGIQIGAVYLQPVIMVPKLSTFPKDPDVHLEADIHAIKGNPNGFAPGEWIPYLTIAYHLEKFDKAGGKVVWQKTGSFMPMVANDGPHYGANVKLDGPGVYQLTYNVEPPSYNSFFRHTDKETGVSPWWKPFNVTFKPFVYAGVGKKGGY